MLIVLFFVFLKSKQVEIDALQNIKNKNILGLLLLIFTVLYIGTRPISGKYFVDMLTYANDFERYATGEKKVVEEKDYAFNYFMILCSKVMDVYGFFVLCAVLYVVPLYHFSKKHFKEYWFYSFFILIVSFSFWAYGVNGIRNGIATSLFLLALSFDKKIITAFIFFLAISFHKTLLLPIIAYVLTMYYTNTKTLLGLWILAIPLSLVLGEFLESFFLGLNFFEDERLNEYLGGVDEEIMGQFSSTGFRWDFLLYSATGVFAGWYFVVKKGYEDKLYIQIFNTYIIANIFWVLMIRASFSNRFAYLSWFLLGIVTIYPFLKLKFFENQHQKVATILLATFAFTYLMYFLTGVR